jgi:tRNA(Arg) A34 adenosine deaminase TadA
MDSSIDVRQLDNLKEQLFALTREAIKQTGMPYASMLVDRATGVVITKDFNNSVTTYDPSDQCSVAGIRKAQAALETSDLSHVYIFGFFEPTVLSFDIAMFAKITNFAWCINAGDAPEHYIIKEYSLHDYAKQHPNAVHVHPGYAREEALQLLHGATLNIPANYRMEGEAFNKLWGPNGISSS